MTIFAQALRTFGCEEMAPMDYAFFSLAMVVGTGVLMWAGLALVFHTIDRIENALRRFRTWRRRQRALRQPREEGR
jgi:hypothetical protein